MQSYGTMSTMNQKIPSHRSLRVGPASRGGLSGALGLSSLVLAGVGALAQPDRAWAGAQDGTLEVKPEVRAQTVLCTDGKSHYVAVAPHERLIHQLYYGDGKQFAIVPHEPSGMLSGDNFFEPRYSLKTANTNFRGHDMRVYSSVSLNDAKTECEVRCGDRTKTLPVVAADKAQKLLKDAKFTQSPQKFVPYALMRDERGTYYYVDHGATEQTEKNYRLYVGQKGNLQQQKMTNVVSDSEGEIFSTPSASLRLLVDTSGRRESTWIAEEKRTKLLLVPVAQNMPMIYNELGVYSGQRLGNPCDDL